MSGFWISYLFNLIYASELLVISLIALLLHIFLEISILIFITLFGLWLVIPLFITLGLGVLSKNPGSTPKQKNINPYSKKTDDYLK